MNEYKENLYTGCFFIVLFFALGIYALKPIDCYSTFDGNVSFVDFEQECFCVSNDNVGSKCFSFRGHHDYWKNLNDSKGLYGKDCKVWYSQEVSKIGQYRNVYMAQFSLDGEIVCEYDSPIVMPLLFFLLGVLSLFFTIFTVKRQKKN